MAVGAVDGRLALRGRSKRGVDELFVSREAVFESATTSAMVRIVVVAVEEGIVLSERSELRVLVVEEILFSRNAVDPILVNCVAMVASTTEDLSETEVGKIVVVVEGRLVLRERRESGPKELVVS